MTVRVEFFGIVRRWAETDQTQLEADDLAEAIGKLRRLFPRLDGLCIDENGFLPGFIANLNGRQFVSDPSITLAENDCLLIMSVDVGG